MQPLAFFSEVILNFNTFKVSSFIFNVAPLASKRQEMGGKGCRREKGEKIRGMQT